MDPEVIILCVVSQKRQKSDDTAYMWKLKYDTHELLYKTENRLTDTENQLTVTRREREKGIY